MSYEDARKFLEEISKSGSKLGLEPLANLLDKLGNPQESLKFIHIAGTNGKGSTGAYISYILAMAGYKVGRYISPVIKDPRESIQTLELQKSIVPIEVDVMGSSAEKLKATIIDKETYSLIVDEIKVAYETIQSEGGPLPTIFEVETAMSFLYYVRANTDVVVLEVGMGGRLDATNVINSKLCAVLTSISMDHMQFLGDTLGKIAYEKAGIIKEDNVVISYEQEPEAAKVIEEVCSEKNATLTMCDFQKIKKVVHSFDGITFEYEDFGTISLSLLGENQVKNAVVAIEVAKALVKQGFAITVDMIKEGLQATKWQGRFELVSKEPYFLIDGAHNEDAAKSLARSIELYVPHKKLIYLIGILGDKDYKAVLKHTLPYAKAVFTFTSSNPRALPSGELTKEVLDTLEGLEIPLCNESNMSEGQVLVYDARTVKEAVRKAYEFAEADDVILAFGSLSYQGELYKELGF